MNADTLKTALWKLTELAEKAVQGTWTPSWDTVLQVHRAIGDEAPEFCAAELEELEGSRGTKRGRLIYFTTRTVAVVTLEAAPHSNMVRNVDQGAMSVRLLPRRDLVSIEVLTPTIPHRSAMQFRDDEAWEPGAEERLRYRDEVDPIVLGRGATPEGLERLYPGLVEDLNTV